MHTHVLSDRDSIVANGEKEEKSERIEEKEANTYIEKSKGDR